MPATEKERKHFRAIGRAMAAEKEEQRRQALESKPAERVVTGFLLGAGRRSAAVEEALDERAAGQIGLALAARRRRR